LLFVKGIDSVSSFLSFRTIDSTLAQFFQPVGKVVSTNIITRGPRSLGYGFIEFETEEEARNAVNTLNKKQLDTREINVELAKPRVERPKNTEAPRGSFAKRGRRPRGPNNRSPQNNNNAQNPEENNNAQNAEAPGPDAVNANASTPQGRSPTKRNNNRRRFSRQRDQTQSQVQGQGQPPQEGEQKPRQRQQSREGQPQPNTQNPGQGQQTDAGSRGRRRGRNRGRGGRGRGFYERPPRNQNRTESTTSLFVANLPFDLTDDKLQEQFKEFNATKAHVVTNYQGRSRGFGFVEFANEKDQNTAFTATNQNKIVISDRPLTVKIALLDDKPLRQVEAALDPVGPDTSSPVAAQPKN